MVLHPDDVHGAYVRHDLCLVRFFPWYRDPGTVLLPRRHGHRQRGRPHHDCEFRVPAETSVAREGGRGRSVRIEYAATGAPKGERSAGRLGNHGDLVNYGDPGPEIDGSLPSGSQQLYF